VTDGDDLRLKALREELMKEMEVVKKDVHGELSGIREALGKVENSVSNFKWGLGLLFLVFTAILGILTFLADNS
jgi:hypothetical protein